MRPKKIDKLKVLTHLASLSPFFLLIFDALQNNLSANPIREITFRTGRDALGLLVLALAISPFSRFFNIKKILRLRRTIGLYSFFYVCLHFLTFIGLDFGFNLKLIIEEIVKKPFAILGFTTFLILVPLAITSTNGWIKRLGKNWRRLHRLLYVAAILDVAHFLWLSKSKANIKEPVIYGIIIATLLIVRIPPIKKALTFASR